MSGDEEGDNEGDEDYEETTKPKKYKMQRVTAAWSTRAKNEI